MAPPFEGQVAVITGAGSGIGRCLALQLVSEGSHVALADVNEENLRETASMATGVAGSPVVVSTHVVDVSSADQMRQFAADVAQRHSGRVHLLINNAGVSASGTFEQVTPDTFDWVMGINFRGVVNGCREFLPHLRRTQPSRIVNLSSMFGFIGVPGQAAYCSSKFAVRGFSDSLRQELEGSGVGVTCVHPGGVKTAIARSSRPVEGGRVKITSREAKLLGLDPSTTDVADDWVRQDFERAYLKMPPENAARLILNAVRCKQDRLLVGKDAKIVDIISRLFPARYYKMPQSVIGVLLILLLLVIPAAHAFVAVKWLKARLN